VCHFSRNTTHSLFDEFRGAESQNIWQANAELYREFGKRLISGGQPTQAFEVLQEGLLYHNSDPELILLFATAVARGGNIARAVKHVDSLLGTADLRVDLQVGALILKGSIFKELTGRAGDRQSKIAFASEAARFYEHAYKISGDTYPAICAASMYFVTGDLKRARELAKIVLRQLKSRLRQADSARDCRLFATMAEANLLLENRSAAQEYYLRAIELAHAGSRIGDIASMRRNVALMHNVGLEIAGDVLGFLQLGRVVYFTGPKIDRARKGQSATPPMGFSPDQGFEQAVRHVIAENIERLHATVGFCSGACGSDLLFAEEMLSRNVRGRVKLGQ